MPINPPEFLTLEMVDEISEIVRFRQGKFTDESLDTSIKVVLLNYGDQRRMAHCMRRDWTGPKSKLAQAPSGLPICPRCGSPCTEDALGWRLALVREKEGEGQWDL